MCRGNRVAVGAGLSRSRAARGSIMPFLAVCLIVIMGAAGICIDLQRDFQAAAELRFAAQSAAIYALSMSCNADGSYDGVSAKANISQALQSAYATANTAQEGPQSTGTLNGAWSGPVDFQQSNLNLLQNPNSADSGDLLLQLAASRDEDSALKQFFLPLWNTSVLSGVSSRLALSSISSVQTVEVIAQPASRIGAGPSNQGASIRDEELAGFAAFPLAISNRQFAQIADPAQTATSYTIDLVNSQSASSKPAAGHIKGCFVNLKMDSKQTYGAAQGDAAIDQLEGQFNYFGASAQAQVIAPALVECGSRLSGFDALDPSYRARQTEISQVVSQIPLKRFFIIPVLSSDPSFASSNQVVGFARLALYGQPLVVKGMLISLPVQLGDSVPLRNACAVAGRSSLDPEGATLMPAPVFPFLPRQVDSVSGGITTRPRGVVMAPCLSPRSIKTATST